MPEDINLWQIEFTGGIQFEFGTLATDYPFATQVEIGPADIITEDQRHPTSDGEMFGRDLMGGFNLTFRLTTVPDDPNLDEGAKIDEALDLAGRFRAKWLNSSSRRLPGEYVTLLNKRRGRIVYGRPRRCAPDHAKLRRGVVGLIADFRSNNPNFYSLVEHAEVFSSTPGSVGGFIAPITPPITTGAAFSQDGILVNEGEVPTWPIIEFHGPGTQHSFELVDFGWQLVVDGPLKYDEVLRVDTRPWSRGVTINGKAANGRVKGSQLEQCRIAVGSDTGIYKTWDTTGTAFAVVYWRDAWASL